MGRLSSIVWADGECHHGHIREEKREVTGGKRTAGGKQREGDSERGATLVSTAEQTWTRHAGKAAPDSRKGRKPGFPSEPPDSTHSQLKQEEEKGETIYLFPRKRKLQVLEPQSALLHNPGNRNWITAAVGRGWVGWGTSFPDLCLPFRCLLSHFFRTGNMMLRKCMCELSQPRGNRSGLSSTQPRERPVSLISVKKGQGEGTQTLSLLRNTAFYQWSPGGRGTSPKAPSSDISRRIFLRQVLYQSAVDWRFPSQNSCWILTPMWQYLEAGSLGGDYVERMKPLR